MMIVETMTDIKCSEKEQEAHQARVSYYQSLGHPIVYGLSGPEIVPFRNGVPDYNAQRTVIWDIPRETPDGTFEIEAPHDVTPSYTGSPQWDYVVRERPEEWSTGMEDMQFNAQWDTPNFE